MKCLKKQTLVEFFAEDNFIWLLSASDATNDKMRNFKWNFGNTLQEKKGSLKILKGFLVIERKCLGNPVFNDVFY